jgi:hypothetical protein
MLVGPLPIKTQQPQYVDRVVKLAAHKLSNAVPVEAEAETQPQHAARPPLEAVPSAADAIPFDINRQTVDDLHPAE